MIKTLKREAKLKMKEKNLIILCSVIVLCMLVISGMIILSSNNSQNNSNNETEVTINITNNTTENNNSTVSTKQQTTSKKSNNKKEDTNTIEGDEITIQHDMGDDMEYIGTENNVYFKNKKTGITYRREKEPGSGVYDYVPIN